MDSIPFEISDDHGHKITGLMLLEEEYLVFEIQVLEWSISRLPTQIVKAELAVVNHIWFKQGIFKDRIFVVPKRSELLEAIPGTHKGEIRLKVAKRYREQAQQFVAEVLQRKQGIKAV